MEHLFNGVIIRIDEEDLPLLYSERWYFSKNYLVHGEGNAKYKSFEKFHRIIMKAKKGEYVDHIDRDTLNNEKSNLRLCTSRMNRHNSKKRIGTINNFKGTQWRKNLNAWQSRCRMNGQDYFLGHFKTELAAAIAYNNKAKELSPVALLNNIELSEQESDLILERDRLVERIADYKSKYKYVYWHKKHKTWMISCLIGKNKRFRKHGFKTDKAAFDYLSTRLYTGVDNMEAKLLC